MERYDHHGADSSVVGRVGFFPGSFDPLTYGHIDTIRRAARVVDKLVVGIGVHPHKKALLSVEVREALIRAELGGVISDVIPFDGLAVEAARHVSAFLIIRGIRDPGDYQHELRMANVNSKLAPGIETLFLLASPEVAFISSSGVREILFSETRRDVSAFVPGSVDRALRGLGL